MVAWRSSNAHAATAEAATATRAESAGSVSEGAEVLADCVRAPMEAVYVLGHAQRGHADDSVVTLRRKRAWLVAEMRRMMRARATRLRQLELAQRLARSAQERAAVGRSAAVSFRWMARYIDNMRSAMQYISYLLAHNAL